MKPFLQNLLKTDSGFSAKTFAGILGWLLCMVFAAYSVFHTVEMTASGELFMVLSCALLGVDSVERIVEAICGKWNKDAKNTITND